MVSPALLEAWHRLPFAKLCIIYMAGIGVGYSFEIGSLLFRVLALIAGLSLCALLALYFTKGSYSRLLFPYFWYLCLFLGPLLRMQQQLPQHQAQHFQHFPATYMQGVILEEPVIGERVIRFPLRVEWSLVGDSAIASRGVVMLSLLRDSLEKEYHYGDRLIFKNRAVAPASPYNPKQFDYRSYLRKKGIYQQALLGADDLQLVERNKGFALLHYALALRIQLRDKFKQQLSDGVSYQVSTALVFGYRAALDAEVRDTFSHTGTIHILAVSGLHVGLLFYLLNFILRFLDRLSAGKMLRLLLILLIIWGYVFLTGMAAAILRAGIMISFFILSECIGQQQNKLNSLFASAFCLLVAQPNMLFDLGFQLSYSAMLGIFTYYPLLKKSFKIAQVPLRKLADYCFIAIAAQLFTAPWVIYYFQEFPNLFLLGNLLIALPLMAIMYVAVALALCPVDSLSTIFAFIVDQLIQLTYSGLQCIERMPLAVTRGMELDAVQLLLSFCLLFAALFSWQLKSKLFLRNTGIVLLLLSMYSSYLGYRAYSFRGIKFYNTARDISVAVFNEASVTLYSTVDSLKHARLKSLVWPDLKRHQAVGKLDFVHLAHSKEVNYLLTALGKRVLIINKEVLHQELPAFDILLWRLRKPQLIRSFPSAWQGELILLDGLQSSLSLRQSQFILDSLAQPYYVLKDNFAYVWTSNEDGK